MVDGKDNSEKKEPENMQTDEASAPTGVKTDTVSTDFPQFLKEIRKGQLLFECSEELEKLVAAVVDTKKSGTLTLTVKVGPLKGDDVSTLGIDALAKAKLPEKTKQTAIFFPTKKNTLQRTDPRQGELEI